MNVLSILADSWDSLAEDFWKEDVFGVSSKLENATFLTHVSTKGKWLFKPYDLRKKIFECAKVIDVHAYEKSKKGLGFGLIEKLKDE